MWSIFFFQTPPSRFPQLGVTGWLWPHLCSMTLPASVPRCSKQLAGSCAANKALLHTKPCCTHWPCARGPSCAAMSPFLLWCQCQGAAPHPVPGVCGDGSPFIWCQGQWGTPSPRHFPVQPPFSLAALIFPWVSAELLQRFYLHIPRSRWLWESIFLACTHLSCPYWRGKTR